LHCTAAQHIGPIDGKLDASLIDASLLLCTAAAQFMGGTGGCVPTGTLASTVDSDELLVQHCIIPRN
jgi:hypothetical protein